MNKILPGTIQTLTVLEKTKNGWLLGTETDQVLLPKIDIRNLGDQLTEIEVFTFYNENKELEATTLLPDFEAGEVGVAKVKNVSSIGAFVSIGSKRDILIPNREQKEQLEEGQNVLIALADDPRNKRLMATTRLSTVLETTNIPYKRGDEVELMIGEKIEIGRRVIVDGRFIGVLFRQEMIHDVKVGQIVKGYIRKVEGKDIQVSMQKEGIALLDDAQQKLLNYLEMNGGYVRLNDDTSPEEIKLRLHMSKKTFKRAAGMLYNNGKILLTKFGLKINNTGELPQDWEERSKQWAKDKEDDLRTTSKRSLPTRNGTENRSDSRPPRQETGAREYKRDFAERRDPRPSGEDESQPMDRKVDKKGSFARSAYEKAQEKEQKRKEAKLPSSSRFQKTSKTSKFVKKKSGGKRK